jgi:hypothetical protein
MRVDTGLFIDQMVIVCQFQALCHTRCDGQSDLSVVFPPAVWYNPDLLNSYSFP